jgi:hypothetical protein
MADCVCIALLDEIRDLLTPSGTVLASIEVVPS